MLGSRNQERIMQTTRSEKLDLRLTPQAKRTLNTAASAAGRSVSEFVLESALARAEETLADRRHFGLDASDGKYSWQHWTSRHATCQPWSGSCASPACSKVAEGR